MNTKLRALIIDDEELARRLTTEYLRSHSDIEIIGECENGIEAVDAITTLQPDLIFLDIQMPKLNGFEVLAASERQDGVIFTTAYDQYALKAFDQHAIDYLLKPYSQQRFDEALTKARKLLGQNNPAVQALVSQTNAIAERLTVRDRGQTFVIPVDQIDYIEAQDDYVQIHYAGKSLLKNAKPFRIRETTQSRIFRAHPSLDHHPPSITQMS